MHVGVLCCHFCFIFWVTLPLLLVFETQVLRKWFWRINRSSDVVRGEIVPTVALAPESRTE